MRCVFMHLLLYQVFYHLPLFLFSLSCGMRFKSLYSFCLRFSDVSSSSNFFCNAAKNNKNNSHSSQGVRDRGRDSESASGPNPRLSAACLAPFHVCLLSLSAIQRGGEMQPPRPALAPLRSRAVQQPQTSTQFTAHTKLDHVSGALCVLHTCCSPPSLINDQTP